ncbi:uncharacterized protein C9orf57 homolog [Dromiciops gliroides]|uniref:uncharacterized protein C9orf57 homolog n=1 Tax=Dromiciops gliroides TaxID=33562 RepID=UPI001CC4FEEB|nr:uncharacterized protein C9orf57 homolog [Dromiciops gliroides]
MRRIISAVMIILFCISLGGITIICRYCNLSLPFHGCLLDAGTCRANTGQYCKFEYQEQGGVKWFTVKGCTSAKEVCHVRRTIGNTVRVTKCCYHDMCNL